MLSPSEVKTVLEAALLAAQQPLPISELKKMFDEEIGADTVRRLLEELREAWKERGVELAVTAGGGGLPTRPPLPKNPQPSQPARPPRHARPVVRAPAATAHPAPGTPRGH